MFASEDAGTARFASGHAYLSCLKSLSIKPRIRSRDSASIGVLASNASYCGFSTIPRAGQFSSRAENMINLLLLHLAC